MDVAISATQLDLGRTGRRLSSSSGGKMDPKVGHDSPDATMREVRGFYLIDFANSVYSTVGIGGFLPLLIQAAALANAGFPSECPNVLRNETELNSVRAAWSQFAANLTNTTTFYRLAGAGPRACDAVNAPSCWNSTCTGLPKSLLECRDVTGTVEVALLTRGAFVTNPTAYATLCITVSVVLQAVIFFFLGPLADYGASRKRTLLATSWLGASLCFVALAINADTFTVGMLVCPDSMRTHGHTASKHSMATLLSPVSSANTDLAAVACSANLFPQRGRARALPSRWLL
jgi:MFS-type transporter involved in bile tolerance (Atg22 family)